MPNQRDDRIRHGSAKRRAFGFLPLVVAFALLLSFQAVRAAPITTGETPVMGNTLDEGVTSYNVYYSYPSVAQVGTNLTIDLSLHLNQFEGQVEYINGYSLKAQLFVGQDVLTQSVYGPPGFNYLFPGATWGPENMTFALTEADTGVALGTSVNATLAVTLEDTVFYGVPENGYESEPPMEAQAGSLIIENQVATSTTSTSTTTQSSALTILPYALVGSGAVLMAAAVLLPRGPRSTQESTK